MKRKLTSVLLACVASVTTWAYEFCVDGIYYNTSGENAIVTHDGTLRPSYRGAVTIPERVTNEGATYKVTGIDNLAFSGCGELSAVSMPGTLTEIGEQAFSFCYELTEVTLPNGVTAIKPLTFSNCYKLTTVNLPESLSTIGVWAFRMCHSLTDITLPKNVTSISENAFVECLSLKTITIPESVEELGDGAFSLCTSLSSFQGKYATEDNRCLIANGELKAFAPAGLSKYAVPSGASAIGKWTFEGCTGLEEAILPETVTEIRDMAFARCSSLARINLPESVRSLGSSVFAACTSLTEMTIPATLEYTGHYVFAGCTSMRAFYADYATEDHRCLIADGMLLSFAPAGLSSYTLDSTVTSIDGLTFSDCIELNTLNLPESVTEIGHQAFTRCTGLKTVNVPKPTATIGDYAFSGCTGLTSLTAENDNPGDISLGQSVFMGVPTHSCILYVPHGSGKLYAVADQWREFTHIVEKSGDDDTTGAIAPEADPWTGEKICYDLNGRRVTNPTKGIYIHQGKKILLK